VQQLWLPAFKSHAGTVLPLGPVTLLHGDSGAGKSNALDALVALSGLAGGRELEEALSVVRGGLAGCVPHGRRGFRLGCSVGTPQGTVRLDVTVRTDGRPRVAAERLELDGQPLLCTGEEDRARGRINAAWFSGGRQRDIQAPLSASSLLTAQLPLRVAGATPGERQVLTAVEQLLTALRELFVIDPVPGLMRGWDRELDDARLSSSGENLSAVIARLQGECRIRYGKLVRAVRAGSPHPVAGLGVLRDAAPAPARVTAALDEGGGRWTPAALLGAGTLRRLAFATVLLTGPEVLQMESAAEVPDADRLLTVLAEDLDADLYPVLLPLADEVAARGHVRLLATGRAPAELPGVLDVHCRRDPGTGASDLVPAGRAVSATMAP
jgi:predicted ATPase